MKNIVVYYQYNTVFLFEKNNLERDESFLSFPASNECKAKSSCEIQKKGGVFLNHLVKKVQKTHDPEAFVKLMELQKQSMIKTAKAYLSNEEMEAHLITIDYDQERAASGYDDKMKRILC